MSTKIVLVYQSLLGIYGDQGNSKVLRQRLAWRGIDAHVESVEPGEPVPADGAVYLLQDEGPLVRLDPAAAR